MNKKRYIQHLPGGPHINMASSYLTPLTRHLQSTMKRALTIGRRPLTKKCPRSRSHFELAMAYLLNNARPGDNSSGTQKSDVI